MAATMFFMLLGSSVVPSNTVTIDNDHNVRKLKQNCAEEVGRGLVFLSKVARGRFRWIIARSAHSQIEAL